MYHVRLTPSPEDDHVSVSRINTVFSSNSGVYFAVQEHGTREGGLHFHILFQHQMGVSTVRSWIISQFPGVGAGGKGGKGRYQLQLADVDRDDKWKPYRYLCKGSGPTELPIVVGGTPPIGKNVPQLHCEYWTINRQIVADAKAAREKSKATVMEAAVLHFATYMWPDSFEQSVQDIWTFFLDDKVANNKLTNETIISGYVTTIINKYFPARKVQFAKTQAQKTIEKYNGYR